MAATRTISCNLGENVTGIGYQFFNASGLLGSRVTTSISNPRTGVYYKTSVTPDSGAIGVYFDNTAGDIFASEVFEENPQPANVTELLGTAWLTPGTAGTPDVNVKLISADSAAADNLERWFDGTVGFSTSGSDLVMANLAVTVASIDDISGNTITYGGADLGNLILESLTVNTTTTFTGAVTGTNASNNLRINGVAPGASGGLLISGSNSGTTTLGALTVTGATTLTGAVSLGSTLGVTGATTFAAVTASGTVTFNAFTVTTTLTSGSANITGDFDIGGELNVTVNGIAWNAAWDTEVQSEVQDAIEANRLDELLAADSDIDGAAPPTVGSVFFELLTKTTGSFTYDQTTDSMEAIRDRGDAAWTGGGGLTVADIADGVWDELLSGHVIVGSAGAGLSAAGGSGDPWSTAVPGAYAAGTAGYKFGAIYTSTQLITVGGVNIVSAVNDDGNEITLYQGDDYLNTDSRAITFTGISGCPVLTAGTVVLKIGASLSVTGTVTAADACRFDITRTQTAALDVGRKKFEIQATLSNASVVTVVTGTTIIKNQI